MGSIPGSASSLGEGIGYSWASLMAQIVKNLPAMQEAWVQSLVRKIPLEKGNGNPLQYSCLENPMDRRVWQAAVHGVTKESDRTEQLTLSL